MEEANSVINPTLEKGSLVLVTGATGFVASHIVDQLLEAGYNVRGTSRSEEKAAWLHTLFDAKYGPGRFSSVVVPDMQADNAFDAAVQGVSGICHSATVMTFSANPDEVIPPVVKGTLEILKSATKEASVKSIVLTSSSSAVITPVPDEKIVLTKTSWNERAIAEAVSNPSPFIVYGASKAEGERAFWKAIEATKPPFQAVAVLPNRNFGPILKPDGEKASSTATLLLRLFEGGEMGGVPEWFVDVRDTARLHVIALIDPSCNGERIFAFAEPFNTNDLLAVFRKLYPGRQFQGDIEGEGRDLSEVPNEDAAALLQKHYGRGFLSLEESVKANTASAAKA